MGIYGKIRNVRKTAHIGGMNDGEDQIFDVGYWRRDHGSLS